jgi:hypothetical protein
MRDRPALKRGPENQFCSPFEDQVQGESSVPASDVSHARPMAAIRVPTQRNGQVQSKYIADFGGSPASDGRRDVRELRALAATGGLAPEAARSSATRARLSAAAYDMAFPLVYARVTRPVERQRRHWACAMSIERLADDCIDGFHDDVEAVVDYLFRHATKPIANLEGWLVSRLKVAIVDGYRRRRGQRGALQRPRVPTWLAAELGSDRWLLDLSIEMLGWVGVATAAGTGVWPVNSWADRRASVTGDWERADVDTVSRDIETVLVAMRSRPEWYNDHVEAPLGRKRAPVASTAPDGFPDPTPLLLADRHEMDESRLAHMAAAAVERLAGLLRSGSEPPAEAVSEVLRDVFVDTFDATDLDRAPHDGDSTAELVAMLAEDPRVVARVVATLRDIVAEELTATRPSVPR